MIRKNKLIALWIWLVVYLPLSAQLPNSENSQVLTVAQYFDLVLSNHPIAKQVRLDNKIAEAAILKARGAFDPKVGWKDSGKTLSGVSYYESQSSYLTVPTWFGIELTAGRDQITGANVNPSMKTPDQGLYYAGISIPLGAGFWINERMAELKKAKIAQTQTQAEQVLAYNELLFRASQAYGNWIAAHQKLNLYDQMQANAELRLAGVQQQVLQGDKPEIERLEASIAVQNRNLQREQAKIELIKKTLEVSNFLWDEQGRPLVLAPELIPEDSLDEVLERWLVIEGIDVAQTVLNHPKMEYLRAKIAESQVDRKLLRDAIKPQVNFNYQRLTTEAVLPQNWMDNNNQVAGLSVQIPLLWRKERGGIQSIQAKIEQQQWNLAYTQQEWTNEITGQIQQVASLETQFKLNQAIAEDYKTLLNAEQTKWSYGESSLFLVNTRENSYIDAQIKRLSLGAYLWEAKAKTIKDLAWFVTAIPTQKAPLLGPQPVELDR